MVREQGLERKRADRCIVQRKPRNVKLQNENLRDVGVSLASSSALDELSVADEAEFESTGVGILHQRMMSLFIKAGKREETSTRVSAIHLTYTRQLSASEDVARTMFCFIKQSRSCGSTSSRLNVEERGLAAIDHNIMIINVSTANPE